MKNYENYHASLLSRKIFEGKLMFMMPRICKQVEKAVFLGPYRWKGQNKVGIFNPPLL